MKTCPSCHADNADAYKHCQNCGKLLDALGDVAPDATVLAKAGAVAEAVRSRSGGDAGSAVLFAEPVPLARLFGAKDRLVIGRAPDCDVQLPHPLVSRYHALLERRPYGLRLRDLASVNGVWINGARIAEPAEVAEGQRIGIGPFLFTLQDGLVRSLDNSRSLRLEARELSKVVPIGRGQTKALLDNVNLVVEPGEFVSILGPSGCGKSTLMDALNGRRRATGGRVLANGEDFYLHYDNFRNSLGYVPQKDIVHTGLSVYKALYYTARLRLPRDTDRSELKARVEEVLAEMELGPHRGTLIANLSGGQIKRVSLGAELLAQPALLYIDEATSGLDAGTEGRMMKLFAKLAKEGRSILCITHNIDNVDQCDLIIVLARGKLVYYGPPKEAPEHFGARRLGDIYDHLRDEDLPKWEEAFRTSAQYAQYVEGRLKATAAPPPTSTLLRLPAVAGVGSMLTGKGPAHDQADRRTGAPGTDEAANGAGSFPDLPPLPAGPGALAPPGTPARRGLWANPFAIVGLNRRPPLAESFRQLRDRAHRLRALLVPLIDSWRQFRVLTYRYLELIWNDKRGLSFVLLQAPFIGVLLVVAFFNRPYREEVPMPRRLSAEDKRVLRAAQALGRAAYDQPDHKDDDLTDASVEVIGADGKKTPMPLTRKQLRALLGGPAEEIQGVPLDRKQLADAEVTYTSDGENSAVKVSEVQGALHKLHDQKVVDMLLKAKGPIIPSEIIVNPRYTYMVLFILVMIVVWCGCNNAAKEIVKEEPVFSRERAVNLGIVPYLASKFLVQSLVTIGQSALLMGILFGTQEALARFDPQNYSAPLIPEHMLPYPQLFGVLAMLSMTSVAMGLLLSACVNSPDKANALLPYMLIPQLLLGGGFLQVNEGLMYWLAMLGSPVYWAFRAVHRGANVFPEGLAFHVPYDDNAVIPCLALGAQTACMLLLTAWFLRRKGA